MNDLLERIQQVDLAVLRRLNLVQESGALPFFRAVSDSTSVIAYGVPAVMFVVAAWRKQRSGMLGAGLIFLTVIVADYSALALKLWLKRERPYAIHEFIIAHSDGGNPSFPSGHSVQAFAMAIAVAIWFRRPSVRAVVLVWACLVGLSRIALGVHYPSDVLGAALLAAIVACVVMLPLVRLLRLSGSGREGH